MPEVESGRDPFGANRGETIKQRADGLSGRIRKHLHDKYYIPPYRPNNRNWEITFASLGWKRRTIQKFWRLYCQINVSRDGGIKLEEFLDFFELDMTPTTERCFEYWNTTGGGDIDFLEFMVSVWNMCTFKIDTLSNFAFDMYDLDSDGELSIPEIENMVEELYGEKGGRLCLKQATQYAEERGGALSLNAFIAFTATHQSLLFPMFVIQRKLQRKIFGVRYWESVERKSKEERGNNHNNFNPRHVQILLRTYQTGGAVAVLSHTGDPNKGLRDWYENKKQHDVVDDDGEQTAERPSMQRWKSIRDNVKSKTGTNQWNMKVFKQRRLNRTKSGVDQVAAASTAGYASADDRPLPSAPPLPSGDTTPPRTSRPGSASKPPPDVAEALKSIRAKRASTPVKDAASTSKQNIPGTVPPPDIAEALQKIRSKRQDKPFNNDGDNPAEEKNAKKRKDRRRRRTKATSATPYNDRRRQAGSMFVPTGQLNGMK